MRKFIRLGGPVLVLAVVLGTIYAVAPVAKNAESKSLTIDGKVIPLADLVPRSGTKLDADAAPHWLALVDGDGKVYPLVKDSQSRKFFLDKALLNRPMRVVGKMVPGSTVLRVMSAQSLIKGKPHVIYYWCDVCSIRRNEKMICECCGGKMDLQEDPVK